MLQQTLDKGLNTLLGGTGFGHGILLNHFGLLGFGGLGLFLRLPLGPLGLGCSGRLRFGRGGGSGLGLKLDLSLGLFRGLLGLGLAAGGGGQGGGGNGHRLVGLIAHLDLGRLSAEAQETGLGLLQNLHRHAGTVQLQLLQSGGNGQIQRLTGGDNKLFHIHCSLL